MAEGYVHYYCRLYCKLLAGLIVKRPLQTQIFRGANIKNALIYIHTLDNPDDILNIE